MRWVLGQALEADGYEVVQAEDGKEALAAVAEQAPDIMILDHRMPAPDGMEVLRRLRAEGQARSRSSCSRLTATSRRPSRR